MTVTTTAHVNRRGDAREVLGFYRDAVDGELAVATYGDLHAAEQPDQADQVAWGQVTAPSGFRIMAYDVQPSKPYDAGANPFYVALRGDDAAEVQRMWDRLAEGATVLIPLAPAPFAPLYGMLTDRYGTTWIVDVTAG